MLELVRGANLYEGPEDAVREVVQNAIDATLFRFAYDRRCCGESPPQSLEELRRLLEHRPVRVSLERSSKESADPANVRWRLCVEDQGLGLGIDDLPNLLRLGASSRASARQLWHAPRRIVGRRPTLLCPSAFNDLVPTRARPGWWSRHDDYIDRHLPSPFIVTSTSVTVPRVERFVRWLSEQVDRPVDQVASRVLDFLRFADALMGEGWHVQKGYALEGVESTLREAFQLE